MFLFAILLFATQAAAQDFPELTGRVVDGANILSPADEAELTGELGALEQRSSRQLVVATVPSLGGYEIADYGYRLGRAWGIGQEGADNGAILLVAPNERRVRVEVGYGLEPILTDAFSDRVVESTIIPRFRAGDMPGGIKAGVDALIEQLQAPPEVAEREAVAAAQARAERRQGRGDAVNPAAILFWIVIILFVIIPLVRGLSGGGRKYRGRRRRGWGGPVIIWGPSLGGGGGGFGGFGGGGGGGFGGFSGGGGSFGGGGASGSW